MAAERAAVATRVEGNGLLKNITYLFGGQLATWLLAAAWTVVVPRQIGPAGMGQLVTVWSAISFITIVAGLGTRVLVVTEVARAPWSAGQKVIAAVVARLILFVPSAGLMAAYVHFAHFGHYQALLLTIATAALPLTLVSDVLGGAFQGLERMQYLAFLDVTYKSVTMIGGVILVLLGYHVLGLVILGASAAVLVFATSIYWARGEFSLTWQVQLAEVRHMIVDGVPFWLTSLISTFYVWIDSIMLAILASPVEVGWYGVPTKIFAALLFIPVIISTATLPRLSKSFAMGPEHFRRALTPIVELTMVISLPIAAGTVAIAGPAVRLLYGSAFAESGIVLMILALCIPATYLNIVVNQSLVASGRQVIWTKIMAVGAILNVLLNLFAIPAARQGWHDGALGAALSLLATEVLMAVAAVYLARQAIDAAAFGRTARTAVAAAFMGLVTYLAAPFGLVAQIALGAALSAGLAVVLRLITREEIDLGRAFATQLRSRMGGPKAA